MKCPHCEHEARDGARFCEACGHALLEDGSFPRIGNAVRLEIQGRLTEALDEYARLIESHASGVQRAAVLKHLANLHFRMGHLRRAKAYLGAAVELDPANGSVRYLLGVVRYHMGEFDQAIEAFRSALSNDPDQHLAYFWLGNALYHRGDNEQAAGAFQELLERYPNFAVGHFHLGVIYARQGKKREAEEEFRRVLRSHPEDAAARFYVEQAVN
jgi:tetratricopeptide (TPR) repeat protein